MTPHAAVSAVQCRKASLYQREHRDRARPTPGPVDENIENRRPGRDPTTLKLRPSRKTAPSVAPRAAAGESDRPGLPVCS